MCTPEQGTITRLLDEHRQGRDGARDELLRIVYDELRSIARARFGQGGDLDIQPTLIVNDACMRLLDRNQLDAENRRHFFFVLTRKMGDVFKDHVRRAAAAKRGGGEWSRVPMVELETDDDRLKADACELDAALDQFEAIDPSAHQVLMLRFFGGRTLAEVQSMTGRTLHEVRKDWDYARAWLRTRLDA